jgi:uncharacterized membrane protein
MTKTARGMPVAVALALGIVLTLFGFMLARTDLLIAGLMVVGAGVVAGIVVVILRPKDDGTKSRLRGD